MNEEQLIKLREEFNAKFAKLNKDVISKLDEIKASHDAVTDTTKNKYGAYFFRVVELVTCACVVYGVLNRLF